MESGVEHDHFVAKEVEKLIKKGKFNEARIEETKFEDNTIKNYYESIMCFKEGKKEKAISFARNYIQSKIFDELGYCQLASIFLSEKKLQEVKKVYQDFKERNPGIESRKLNELLGLAHYNSEDYLSAKEIFSELLRSNDNENFRKKYQIYLIKALSLLGETFKAHKMGEELLKNYPADPYIYEANAMIYSEEFKYDEAIENIRIAIELNPQKFEFKVYELSYLLYQGNYEEVIKRGNEMIKHFTGDKLSRPETVIYFFIASAYRNVGKKFEFLYYLNLYRDKDEWFKEEPNSEYLREMGLYYYDEGDKKEAIKNLERSIEKNKNYIPAIISKINWLFSDGKVEEAKALRDKNFDKISLYEKNILKNSKGKNLINMSLEESFVKSVSLSISCLNDTFEKQKRSKKSFTGKYTKVIIDEENAEKSFILGSINLEKTKIFYDKLEDLVHLIKEKKYDKNLLLEFEYDKAKRSIKAKSYKEGNLRDFLNSHPDISLKTRRHFILSIAKSLKELHDKSGFHGNLKPSNILLKEKYHPENNPFPEIIIYDYELYDAYDMIEGYRDAYVPYVPPEGFRKQKITKKTKYDIFSLGMIIIFIISGVEPYSDKEKEEIKSLIENADLPSIPNITLRESMEKWISYLPEDRESIDEVIEEIQDLYV